MEKGRLMQIGAAVASIGATVYGISELGQIVRLARVGPLRHEEHEARGLRPAGGRVAAGALRAQPACEKHQQALAAANKGDDATARRRAGELDPGYFKPMAQAGVAHYQLGNASAAAPLLEQSMKRLPTAPGADYLGRSNEDRGNTAGAVELYRMAASSKFPIGEDAVA